MDKLYGNQIDAAAQGQQNCYGGYFGRGATPVGDIASAGALAIPAPRTRLQAAALNIDACRGEINGLTTRLGMIVDALIGPDPPAPPDPRREGANTLTSAAKVVEIEVAGERLAAAIERLRVQIQRLEQL